MKNVKQVVLLLKTKLNGWFKSSYSSDSMRYVNNIFFHVKLDDIDKAIQYIVETIKGARDLHSVKFASAMDVNKLMKKSLSCFCFFYADGNSRLWKYTLDQRMGGWGVGFFQYHLCMWNYVGCFWWRWLGSIWIDGTI